MHTNSIECCSAIHNKFNCFFFTAVCRNGAFLHRPIASTATKSIVSPSSFTSKIVEQQRSYITLTSSPGADVKDLAIGLKCLQIANRTNVLNVCQSIRTVTKFSLRSGKRKSVKCVPDRFYRLHWGGWIRTRCGRHKKMHKKKANRKRRLRQHVFVNSTQAWLLDKMVTKFWKRPKHYIDDPYEPYHTRTFWMARRKPQPMPERVE